MCGNDNTATIERDEEIEVLVIEEHEKKITSSSMLASSCTLSCFSSPAWLAAFSNASWVMTKSVAHKMTESTVFVINLVNTKQY